jgi:hypothetical protein
MGVYRVDFYILGFLADTARFKVWIAESRRAAVVYGLRITLRPLSLWNDHQAQTRLAVYNWYQRCGKTYCEDLPPCGPAGGMIKFAGSSTVLRTAEALASAYQYGRKIAWESFVRQPQVRKLHNLVSSLHIKYHGFRWFSCFGNPKTVRMVDQKSMRQNNCERICFTYQ